MIKLGIVSDSHGAHFWIERYLEKCRAEKYDAVFHLGDFHTDARWLERRLDVPLIAVAGNCDVFSNHQRLALAEYEGRKILAAHGHLQDVKYGYDRLSYLAEEQGAQIALFGHTHRQFVGFVGRILMINPGALQVGDCCELLLDGERMVPRELSLADNTKEDE